MRDLVLYGNHESGHSYKVRLFLTLEDRIRALPGWTGQYTLMVR